MTVNQFLKRVVFFISFPIGIFIITLITITYLNNKIFIEYKLNKNVGNIFIGDSHVQLAINDKIVKNSINLSRNSESYIFSFYKINLLLKNNPSIKKIYLGFSYHNLSSYYEDFIFGHSSKDVAPNYFFILPFSENLNFIKYNSKELPTYFKNVFITGFKNVLSKNNKNSYLGYYENGFKSTQAIQNSMDKRLLFQFYKNGKLNKFSNYNIHYLTKIIDLCKKNRIDLVMLNTPLHNYYKNKIPKEYIEKYNEIININDLNVIDFNDLTLSDSCFIPDGDHISEKGALLISKYLND